MLSRLTAGVPAIYTNVRLQQQRTNCCTFARVVISMCYMHMLMTACHCYQHALGAHHDHPCVPIVAHSCCVEYMRAISLLFVLQANLTTLLLTRLAKDGVKLLEAACNMCTTAQSWTSMCYMHMMMRLACLQSHRCCSEQMHAIFKSLLFGFAKSDLTSTEGKQVYASVLLSLVLQAVRASRILAINPALFQTILIISNKLNNHANDKQQQQQQCTLAPTCM